MFQSQNTIRLVILYTLYNVHTIFINTDHSFYLTVKVPVLYTGVIDGNVH